MFHLAIPLLSIALYLPVATPDEIEDPRIALAMESIDPEDIYAYIAYMASDTMYGRNAGTPGNDQVAEWIAGYFKDLGLKPGGEDGTYFQTFEFRPRRVKGEKAVTRNVIGILEGCDPILKKEAVVVGAHFDHVGTKMDASNPGRIGKATAEDTIWNGADDNASGSSAVLEIAQAFSAVKVKTRRSIVFILFSAEEHGLHGSRFYVNNPSIPLEDTVAMINLDMIGRNPKSPVYVLGAETAADNYLKDMADLCAERITGLVLRHSKDLFGGSDHMSFMGKSIPSLFFFSGLHKDYHQINDEVDRIDCNRVADVARCAFLMLYRMGNRDDRPAFTGATWDKKAGIQGRGRMLGIRLGELVKARELEGFGRDKGKGAIRVAGVTRGSAAERAKLEKGDLILSIGKVHIRFKEPVTSLKEGIAAAPAGAETAIEVIRGSELKILQLQWDAKDKNP